MKKRMMILAMLFMGSVMMVNPRTAAAETLRINPAAGAMAITMTIDRTITGEGTADVVGQSQENANGGHDADYGNVSARQVLRDSVSEDNTPEDSALQVAFGIVQVDSCLYIRQEPNTESEVLGKLYNYGAAAVYEATEDGWYRIKSGTVEGYIKGEYIVVGDDELAREAATRYATVNTTTLFVRKEPTTESEIISMLPEGDDLVALDESVDGWVKVSTEAGEGYISTDYVIMTTEYLEAESKAEEEARLAREEAQRRAAAEAAEAARAAKAAEEAAKRQNTTSKGSISSSSVSGTSGASGTSGSSGSNSGNNSSQSSGKGSSNSGNSSSTSHTNGQAVVDYAMQFLGNPYVYGGTSLTNGADCSGFVQSVYRAFGVSLPRTSAQQRSAGYAVSLSEIQPGDIICYSGHVGIYVGNNTLIHASTEKTGITLTSPINYRKILAVRRIF